MAIRPLNIMTAAVAAMLAAGCAASRHVAENDLKVTPAPYAVMPDAVGNVDIDMQFEIPPHYLGRRERIVLLPKIMKDTMVMAEMPPVAIDAPIYIKKISGKPIKNNSCQIAPIYCIRSKFPLKDTQLQFNKIPNPYNIEIALKARIIRKQYFFLILYNST